MDVVLLARIQFALTVGFHFIFPPLTLGLTLLVVILESFFAKTKEDIYRKLSALLVKIVGLVFVLGTATGIVMEFAFGNNWAEYSRMVGDIFGAPLAAEGIFAFFLESVFLGILIFGREKVSNRTYWWSAFFVCLGSHLSGLWIIIANSWMQTPAGYEIVNGKAVLTDFFAAAVNHSTGIRFFHTIIGGWITGAVVAAAIAAWYLLKGKFVDYAKKLLVIAVALFALTSVLQLVHGHMHALQVSKTQPEKMAAFEALWETQKGAPMSLFGIPDQKNKKTYFEIKIPSLLSYLIHFDFDAEVIGLDAYPEDEIPPVLITYTAYHIMIALGMLFIGFSLLGGLLILLNKIWTARWYYIGLIVLAPLTLVAMEVGWIAAEVGRQPWAVYHVLKTADAVSKVVPAWQIVFSLIMFTLVYSLLFVIFLKIFFKIVKKGPETLTPQGY
jgi:cytochrome d ubiquinol oxidase subunit I